MWAKGRTLSTAAQAGAGDGTSTTVKLHSMRYHMQQHECSRGMYKKTNKQAKNTTPNFLLYEIVKNYGPESVPRFSGLFTALRQRNKVQMPYPFLSTGKLWLYQTPLKSMTSLVMY